MIAGIDYSYTSPGVVIFDDSKGQEFSHKHCKFFSYSDNKVDDFDNFYFTRIPKYTNDMERFGNIADWVIGILKKYRVTHISLEDYAKAARGPTFTIGENTGILKYRIHKELKIPILLVAPTQVKKFAHGKGAGKKDLMYNAWIKSTGIDLKGIIQPKRLLGSPTTDIVDGYFLTGYLHHALGTTF